MSKKIVPIKKWNLKKGDTVLVITGNDKGKKGKILKVLRHKNRIVVEGVSIRKKHYRARKQGEQSGIIEIEAPIHISNVMLVCPKCGSATRVGRTITPEGTHVRVCKKCGEMID